MGGWENTGSLNGGGGIPTLEIFFAGYILQIVVEGFSNYI